MDELLEKRIMRALEGLDDEQARKTLDYIEFLQSKYGTRGTKPSAIERIANGVEDTLRVGKLPFNAIKGTRGVFNTADRIVKGVADVGRAVVDEIQTQLQGPESKSNGEREQPKRSEAAETRPAESTEPKQESGSSDPHPDTA